MNRFLLLFLTLCLLLSLTACGGKNQTTPPEPGAGTAEPPDAGSQPEGTAPQQEALSPETASARNEAFAALLRQIHEEWTLPDGTELDHPDMEAVEDNLFALFDVDGDGEQELILLWQNAIVAGQVEIVYGYDETTGEVREKLRDFPGVIFYDNGTAEAFWSHNQGWGNGFWPYTLYQYNAEAETYENAGSADAWDETLMPTAFPHAVDEDGDGMVYVLLKDNWDFVSHTTDQGEEYWYYEQPPVDGAAYLEWRNGILQGADFLEFSFVTLTAENIAEVLHVPYMALSGTTLPNAVG